MAAGLEHVPGAVCFRCGEAKLFGPEIDVRCELCVGGEFEALLTKFSKTHVVATARDPRRIVERFGSSDALLPVALDVTSEPSIASAVEAASSGSAGSTSCVNNAGFGVIGAVEETSAEDVRRLYETNVFGLLAVTRAVLPSLRTQRLGHILNISSVGGYQSGPGFGVYCSTKFAVEGLSEALHGELAPLGIAVTVVEPGYFRTEFLESKSVVESSEIIPDYAATAGQVRTLARSVSLQQPGDPARLQGHGSAFE